MTVIHHQGDHMAFEMTVHVHMLNGQFLGQFKLFLLLSVPFFGDLRIGRLLQAKIM